MSHAQTDTIERMDFCGNTWLITCSPSWNQPGNLQHAPEACGVRANTRRRLSVVAQGYQPRLGGRPRERGTEMSFLSVKTHVITHVPHTPAIANQGSGGFSTRDINDTARPRPPSCRHLSFESRGRRASSHLVFGLCALVPRFLSCLRPLSFGRGAPLTRL